MRRILCISAFLVATFCFRGTNRALAAPAVEQVRSAVVQLRNWASDGKNSQAWHKYLRTEQLEQQLALGSRADRAVVADVLERYESGAAGLEYARFRAVRSALTVWQVELPRWNAESLAEAAKQSVADYVAVTPAQLAVSKVAATKSLRSLDSFLAGGTSKNANQWKEYLQTGRVREQLKRKSDYDIAVLRNSLKQYSSSADGLGLPVFADVRHQLTAFADTAVTLQDAKAQEKYERRLESLSRYLASYAEQPNPQDAYLIGQTIRFVERAGQGDDLVAAVRSHYRRPNLLAEVSERMISAAVSRKIDDVTSIEDNIIGTAIYGTAHTQAQLSADVVPSRNGAIILARLDGVATSNNVGYNGPVTIVSAGKTQINAYKRLRLDARGLTSQPAVARCSTETEITDISARRCFIERLAERRVAKKEGEARQIASEHAEERVEERMNKETQTLLDDSNKQIAELLRRPLLRRDAFPENVDIYSTKDRLHIEAVQSNASQLAAPNDPPPLTGSFDLAVRLHESLVNNVTDTMLAGVNVTDLDMAEMAEKFTGSVPEELQLSDDKEPWSITFHRRQPVIVRFGDKQLSITIRAEQFTRGNETVKKETEISALYLIERTAIGTKLTRQGDVEVKFSKRGRSAAIDSVRKTFLHRKFSAALKKEIVNEGLAINSRIWAHWCCSSSTADRAGWLSAGMLPSRLSKPSLQQRRPQQRPNRQPR